MKKFSLPQSGDKAWLKKLSLFLQMVLAKNIQMYQMKY